MKAIKEFVAERKARAKAILEIRMPQSIKAKVAERLALA